MLNIIISRSEVHRTACFSCHGRRNRKGGKPKPYTLIHGSMAKLQAHVQGTTHKKANEERIRCSRIQQALEVTTNDNVEKEEDVPDDVRAKRMRWLRGTILKGIAPEAMFGRGDKDPGMRPLIEQRGEDGGTLMTSAPHMMKLVPDALKAEYNTVMVELREKKFALITDETPRQGEVSAQLARYVFDPDEYLEAEAIEAARSAARTANTAASSSSSSSSSLSTATTMLPPLPQNPDCPSVQQRLIFLDFLPKTPTANQLCKSLNKGVVTKNALPWAQCVATMTDGAEVNIKAFKQLKAQQHARMFVILCFSHMFSNAGKHISFVMLDLFWKYLQVSLLLDVLTMIYSLDFLRLFSNTRCIQKYQSRTHLLHLSHTHTRAQSVFSHSAIAKALWQEATGKTWVAYNAIRWWSKYHVLRDVASNFDKLVNVVAQLVAAGNCPEGGAKLLRLIRDDDTKWYVKIELQALISIGRPIADITYDNEGDGQEAFSFARQVDDLLAFFSGGDSNDDDEDSDDEGNSEGNNEGHLNWDSLGDITDLFPHAIAWSAASAAVQNYEAAEDELVLVQRTAQEARARVVRPTRPRRQAAIAAGAAVVAAAGGANTAAGQAILAQQNAAQEAALARQQEQDAQFALDMAQYNADVEAEMLKVKEALRKCPPLDAAGWRKHVAKGFAGMIKYVKTRLAKGDPMGGDAGVGVPDGDRYAALEFFKSAALWHPHTTATLTEAELLIRNLRGTLKEFNNAMINGLIEEVGSFLDDARRTVPGNGVDVLKFHFVHRQERPFFWQAAKLLVLCQPTSAAAERVFSLLTKRYGKRSQKWNAIADQIRLSMMLSTNKRKV